MVNLIRNEWMKIYLRPRTWVLYALLIILAITISVCINKIAVPALSGDWKAMLIAENKEMETEVKTEPMPDYAKKMVQQEISTNQYAIDHNININQFTIWKNVKEQTALISLITVFVVIIAGDMVAGEFSWGTVKLLLIRPAKRWKILLAKYLTTLWFAFTLLAVLFISTWILGGILYGFSGMSVPHLYYEDGGVKEGSMFINVIQTFGVQSIQLIMIVTIAFMLSSVFRSSSIAVGLAIVILFTGEAVAKLLLSNFSFGKYFLFANTDLTPYIEGVPLQEGMTLGFSITVLFVYFILFNAASFLLFGKRDIAGT